MSVDRSVLVVVVNTAADWQRVLDQGWYRIPLKHAPHPVAAEYLAFYLTAACGAERWQVRYYAPVVRYRMLTRAELLPDQPAHPRAHELYYRIDIGPLRQLEPPLISRRLRRVTFIPTRLERLLTATDVSELWCCDDATELLWTEFPDVARKATSRLRLEERHRRYAVTIPRTDRLPCYVAT